MGQQSPQQGDQQPAEDQGKKKRTTPKPEWVKRREEATGITAEWSDSERRWTFPGLSTNMGGPKKGATQGTEQKAEGGKTQPKPTDTKTADAKWKQIREFFVNEKYGEAWQLMADDPDIQKDPKKKQLYNLVKQHMGL
jgi:hypothetical protein